MSCSSHGIFRSEQAWILARNKNFRDTSKYEEVKTIANQQFGFKLDGLMKIIKFKLIVFIFLTKYNIKFKAISKLLGMTAHTTF